LTLAEEGAVPVIFARSPLSQPLQEKLSASASGYAFRQLELMDEAACAAAISATAEQYGRIDGVVNNAGINDNVALTASVDEFRLSLEKNLVHYFTVVHHALPHLKKSQGS